MDRLHINICPLCGGKHLEKMMTCTDYYASGEKFAIERCIDCGFMFTQDVPVEAEIGPYYETPDYISHSDTQEGLMNKVYHWVRKFMLFRKMRLVRRISGLKHGHLLDIGTGTAYFAHVASKQGWTVDGIEKSKKAREFALMHFHLKIESEMNMAEYEKSPFDVITLWHSMEHIESLNELWEKIRRVLKPRGFVIVAVPNPSSYDANVYGELWAAYDVPRHLWHFTPSVMQQMGAKHGFILAEQHPMPFDAFYVSMLTEKYKGCRYVFLKGLWVGLKGWLHTLAKKERSSSMIYVFRMK